MVRSAFSFALIWLIMPGGALASSIAYQRVAFRGLVAHAVTVDLNDPQVKVTVALAKGGAGKAETFKSMMKRTRPAAAITGTFFDTRTMIPTGDIAMYGTVVHSGCIGSALCVDRQNRPSVVPIKIGRQTKWAGYETVLCAGPTLVAEGRVAIDLKREGFRSGLMHSTRRTAVGITNSGKLLLVCINRDASLYDLAKLMIKLNTVAALTLDGGSSTAFYHAGEYRAVPQRTLTNCLVAYESPERYEQAKAALAPSKLFPAAEPKPIDVVSALAATDHAPAAIYATVYPPADAYPAVYQERR